MVTHVNAGPVPTRLTAHAPDLFAVTQLISTVIGDIFREKALTIMAESTAKVMDNASHREEIQGHKDMPLLFQAYFLWTTAHNPTPHSRHLLPFEIVFAEVSDDDGVRRLVYPITPERRYTDALLAMEIEGKPLFKTHQGPDWDTAMRSVNPRDNNSFRHLPRWVLPSSVENVIQEVSRQPNVDLNDYINPEKRLRSALRTSVDVTSLKSAQGLNSRTRNTYLRQATTAFLNSPEGQATPRPEPLPVDLSMSVDELPPVFVPNSKATTAVIELFNEAVAKGS